MTTIPVCWEPSAAPFPEERAWVQDAAQNSWSAVSSIRFVGWEPCQLAQQPGLHIRIADEGPSTLGLGRDLDGINGGISLNFEFRSWSPNCAETREYCVRAGAVHELGHALGFAHEQNRPDTPGWCAAEQGLGGDLWFGDWDLDSVMNYCNPRWTGDGKLSGGDITAVRGIYGRTPGDWLLLRSDRDGALLTPSQIGFGFAVGAAWRLLADVDGDGRDDAIAVYGSGAVDVARSVGSGLAVAERWLLPGGAIPNASHAAVDAADVDGDGRADLIVVVDGRWLVSRSTGGQLLEPVEWRSGHGTNADAWMVRDVDGDGRADAVAVYGSDGAWWVALAQEQGFGAPSRWVVGHGFAPKSAAHLLADLDGDGRADAVAVYRNGQWWSALSTGNAFAVPRLAATSHGAAAFTRLLGDFDGDGRADAVVGERRSGRWFMAPSVPVGDEVGFGSARRIAAGLEPALDVVPLQPLVGDLDGDGRADLVLAWP